MNATIAEQMVEKAQHLPTDWSDNQGRIEGNALREFLQECDSWAIDEFNSERSLGSCDPTLIFVFEDCSRLTIDNPNQTAFRAFVSLRDAEDEEALE